MSTKTTIERVTRLVVENLGVNAAEVRPDSRFVEDLGADSLDTIELVMAAEQEFDIEIPDESAEQCTTVAKAVEFIDAAPKLNK